MQALSYPFQDLAPFLSYQYDTQHQCKTLPAQSQLGIGCGSSFAKHRTCSSTRTKTSPYVSLPLHRWEKKSKAPERTMMFEMNKDFKGWTFIVVLKDTVVSILYRREDGYGFSKIC